MFEDSAPCWAHVRQGRKRARSAVGARIGGECYLGRPQRHRPCGGRFQLSSFWRLEMIKTLMAAAVAAAFALPLMASAQSDTGASARQPGVNPPGAASPGSASTTVTGTDRDTGAAGASASGFDRLDKNRDGFISRDEARDASELNTRFSELDRNN